MKGAKKMTKKEKHLLHVRKARLLNILISHHFGSPDGAWLYREDVPLKVIDANLAKQLKRIYGGKK